MNRLQTEAEQPFRKDLAMTFPVILLETHQGGRPDHDQAAQLIEYLGLRFQICRVLIEERAQ